MTHICIDLLLMLVHSKSFTYELYNFTLIAQSVEHASNAKVMGSICTP